jgi:putative ABC transport system permease protein
MKAWRFALAALVRDWKSGELTVLLGALLVAVTALSAVSFFTSRVNQAVVQQAGEVLAADLRLQGGRAVPDKFEREARDRGLATARTIGFPSMVSAGEASDLASIQAVSTGYPLRGRVRIAEVPFGPASETDTLPARGEVWLEGRLMARLGVSVGGHVRVGASELKVGRVLDYRPDQGAGFAELAPTVLLNIDDIPATQLIVPGSRATWAVLFAGDPGAIADFRTWLLAHKTDAYRVVDIGESSEQIRAAMDRAGRFLSLSALATLLLAAVAVAMAARRYAARHLDTVALMKCMGASQRFVLTVSVLELCCVAVIGAVIGVLLGLGAQAALAWLLRDLINGALPPPTLAAAWLGAVTALAMLVGFALPPLLQLRRVPPMRVLRRDLVPPPLTFGVTYGLAAAALAAVLLWLVKDARLVSYVLGGAVVATLVLAAVGALLVKLAGRLRGGVGVAWRYGLANVARRGRESVVQIVAFGLGLTVLLVLAVVRNDLLDSWRASLPPHVPNHFFINIPPDEAAPLQQFFVDHGIAKPTLAPWVRARLTTINGAPVGQLKLLTERGARFVEREQNLSWSATLPQDNKLVAGQWWQGTPAQPEVSVAEEFRDDLGLKLGDRLGFDVAGEEIVATVTSVRAVQWDGFRPNFFLVFSPGVLDGATGTFMTSVFLEPEQRRVLSEFVQRFPSVSVFDVDAILTQIRGVMDRAATAVQYVFLFTLLAGLIVLLAAIQSTRDERRYESAMLRTLGASRAVVLRGVAAEFATLGLLSGVLAAGAASIAGYFLATELFSLKYSFDLKVWLAGMSAGALLVGLAGTLATRSVVDSPPIATLRQT